MEKNCITLGLFVFGVFLVYLGARIRLGGWRDAFLWGGFPVLASPGAFLIAIPLGLGLVTVGLMMIFPEYNDLLTTPLAISSFLTILLIFWLPDWLLPAWLRWLMKNYEPVLSQMFEEARQMGIKEWESQTRTQAGLEQWADSVAAKHGWRRSGPQSEEHGNAPPLTIHN